MCGAAHGPDHDDPLAAAVCDRYHALVDRYGHAVLTRLRADLDERDRELLWQLALGIGPDGLARRLQTSAESVRADLRRLAARLDAPGSAEAAAEPREPPGLPERPAMEARPS